MEELIEQAQLEILRQDQTLEAMSLERAQLEASLGADDPNSLTDFNSTVCGRHIDSRNQVSESGSGELLNRSADCGSFSKDSTDKEKWLSDQRAWVDEGRQFVTDSLTFYHKYAPGNGDHFSTVYKKAAEKKKELETTVEQYSVMVDEKRFGTQWVNEIREIVQLKSTLTELKDIVEEKKKVYEHEVAIRD